MITHQWCVVSGTLPSLPVHQVLLTVIHTCPCHMSLSTDNGGEYIKHLHTNSRKYYMWYVYIYTIHLNSEITNKLTNDFQSIKKIIRSITNIAAVHCGIHRYRGSIRTDGMNRNMLKVD